MERRGELALTIIIAFGLLGGLAWDLVGHSVEPPADGASSTSLFYERALFCPPRPHGVQGGSYVTAWSATGEDANVSVRSDGTDGASDAVELPGEAQFSQKLASAGPFDVIGSGSPLLATTTMSFQDVHLEKAAPFPAVASAPCSAKASGDWYFPEGSSEFRTDERLLIYNPFPDEAVVRVTFITQDGEEAKANLAKVPVPSGETAEVKVNRFVQLRQAIAAHVSAVRGRVVAWKLMFARPEGRAPGAEFSLGATDVVTRSFFPLGEVDEGSTARITILNPSDEEATVTVSFITSGGLIQPNQFVDMKVERHTIKVVPLSTLAGKKAEPPGPVSAKVESSNAVGIMAEQSLEYGSGSFEGVGADQGIAEPAESWWLGPAASVPSLDAIVLLNLGGKPAHVDVSLLSPDGNVSRPAALQGIKVGTGKRAEIGISKEVGDRSLVARIDSDQPVVAARISQGNGDIGVVAGVAVTPSEP